MSGALPAPRVSLRLYPRACDAAFAFRPPPLPRALYKLLRRAPSRRFGREREAAARASQPSEEPRQQQQKRKQGSQPSEELRQQRVGLPQQASVGGRHAEGGVRILRTIPPGYRIQCGFTVLWVVR